MLMAGSEVEEYRSVGNVHLMLLHALSIIVISALLCDNRPSIGKKTLFVLLGICRHYHIRSHLLTPQLSFSRLRHLDLEVESPQAPADNRLSQRLPDRHKLIPTGPRYSQTSPSSSNATGVFGTTTYPARCRSPPTHSSLHETFCTPAIKWLFLRARQVSQQTDFPLAPKPSIL